MEKTGSDNEILTGSLWKQLIIFGMPLLLGNLFQQLYSSVDSVIVGRYVGEKALAAVGSTTSLVFFIVSFFQGVATGTSVVIAQYFGAGNKGQVKRSISTSLLISAVSGVALAILFFFLTPFILRWMLTPEDIFVLTRDYLQIYMLSIPVIALYNTGTAVLRAMGDSRRPLYFLIFSSLVNVVLDLLFIRVFHMGVVGASVATAIAQAISAALVIYVLVRHTGEYSMNGRDICFDKALGKRILALGLPAGIQSSAVSFANILFQSQVNTFGSIAVAGYSAGSRIQAFVYMPCTAFGLAATTFVGQNIGARNYSRVKECARVCLLLSTGITFFFGLLTFLFRYPLLRIFTDGPEVIAYGALSLTVMGLPTFLWAFPHILGCVVTGAGKSFAAMVVTMANMCVLRLIWIFVMLQFWNNILVVYLSFPVSWVTATLCMIPYYRHVIKNLERTPQLTDEASSCIS